MMNKWMVKYTWHRSSCFDSPLYRAVEYEGFKTFKDAKEWAEAAHPELPGYELVSIYENVVPKNISNYMSAAERSKYSDRNTDYCILMGSNRFK